MKAGRPEGEGMRGRILVPGLLALVLAPAGAAWAQTVNYPTGFTGQTTITLNGGATVNAGRIRLTDAGNQSRSAFTTAQVDVTRFETTFDFQITGTAPLADGLCFVLQRNAATTTGGTGGGLGYVGIANSVAVKFDIYDGGTADPSDSTTGQFAGGAAVAGGFDTLPNNVDLRNANVKRVQAVYDGTTLTVTLRDLVTNGTDTRNYVVNIPSLVGGNTAHAGFTAGTGGLAAVQEIVNWVYTNAPPVPQNLTATGDLGQIVLNWQASAGATGYDILRSDSGLAGSFGLIGSTTAPTVTFTDTTVVPYQTYYYVVRAVSAGGTSADSNVASAMATGQPYFNDHKEGLVDRNCGCGAAAPGPSWAAAALGLFLASLALIRRR
jgi:hypothetical protein